MCRNWQTAAAMTNFSGFTKSTELLTAVIFGRFAAVFFFLTDRISVHFQGHLGYTADRWGGARMGHFRALRCHLQLRLKRRRRRRRWGEGGGGAKQRNGDAKLPSSQQKNILALQASVERTSVWTSFLSGRSSATDPTPPPPHPPSSTPPPFLCPSPLTVHASPPPPPPLLSPPRSPACLTL